MVQLGDYSRLLAERDALQLRLGEVCGLLYIDLAAFLAAQQKDKSQTTLDHT